MRLISGKAKTGQSEAKSRTISRDVQRLSIFRVRNERAQRYQDLKIQSKQYGNILNYCFSLTSATWMDWRPRKISLIAGKRQADQQRNQEFSFDSFNDYLVQDKCNGNGKQ